jgi:hypothetical protein
MWYKINYMWVFFKNEFSCTVTVTVTTRCTYYTYTAMYMLYIFQETSSINYNCCTGTTLTTHAGKVGASTLHMHNLFLWLQHGFPEISWV